MLAGEILFDRAPQAEAFLKENRNALPQDVDIVPIMGLLTNGSINNGIYDI